jgi:general secretion pathway protein B
MSYILDALKRAEAERGGAGPARAALPASFFPAAGASGARARLWLGTGLLGGATALAFALAALGNRPEAAVVTATPAATNQAASPEPATTQAQAVIIPPPPARMPASAPAKAAKAALPPPAPVTLRDLPADIQREIPPLAVGGFLYSANVADRSVLINKRLRREGDEVAPGLVLEALQPNGMVFNYRGYRYRSTY